MFIERVACQGADRKITKFRETCKQKLASGNIISRKTARSETTTLCLSGGVRRPHWGLFGVPGFIDGGNPGSPNEAINYSGGGGGDWKRPVVGSGGGGGCGGRVKVGVGVAEEE